MSDKPACLACGHVFGPEELTAVTARPSDGDRQFVECVSCGADNEIRAKQGQGFEAQPTVEVVRLVDNPPAGESVFAETVRPGIESLPDESGEFESD